MLNYSALLSDDKFRILINLENRSPGCTADLAGYAEEYHARFLEHYSRLSRRKALFDGFLSGFSSLALMFESRADRPFMDHYEKKLDIYTRAYVNCERLAIRRIIRDRRLDEADIIHTESQKQWMKIDNFPEWRKSFNAVQRAVAKTLQLAA